MTSVLLPMREPIVQSVSAAVCLQSPWTHNSIHNSLWAVKSWKLIWQISISWQSPVCGWQLWEQLLSPSLAHLCNCSRPDRVPLYLCHIPSHSAAPHRVHSSVRKATQAGPFLRHGRGPLKELPQPLQAPPDVVWFWQEQRIGGPVFVTLGGCCLQVRWLSTKEDSWQVQQKLTAKHRWQRGTTKELESSCRRTLFDFLREICFGDAANFNS